MDKDIKGHSGVRKQFQKTALMTSHVSELHCGPSKWRIETQREKVIKIKWVQS